MTRPAVLLPDGQQNQAVGQNPDAVEQRAILIGADQQAERDAVARLDPEGEGEVQEEPVARVAPKPEEEQPRKQ